MSYEDELYDDALERERELPNDQKLRGLSDLAARVRRKEEELESLREQQKNVQAERDRLVQQEIPDLMHELGMERFTLSDGTGVELKPEVYASIPEKNRDAALQWLRDNGYGDLIKHTLTVQFGMGEDRTAAQVADELVERGHDFTRKTTVLPQTLKAWVREQDSRGQMVPEDLINVHRVTVAKLKQPK